MLSTITISELSFIERHAASIYQQLSAIKLSQGENDFSVLLYDVTEQEVKEVFVNVGKASSPHTIFKALESQ